MARAGYRFFLKIKKKKKKRRQEEEERSESNVADMWNNSNSSCGVHKIHVLKHRDEMAVLSET
jgi:hypothetical protein